MKKFIIIIIIRNEQNWIVNSYWKSGINAQNSFLYQVFIIYCFRKTKTLKQYHRNFEKIDTNKSNLQKSLSIFLQLHYIYLHSKTPNPMIQINTNQIYYYLIIIYSNKKIIYQFFYNTNLSHLSWYNFPQKRSNKFSLKQIKSKDYQTSPNFPKGRNQANTRSYFQKNPRKLLC